MILPVPLQLEHGVVVSFTLEFTLPELPELSELLNDDELPLFLDLSCLTLLNRSESIALECVKIKITAKENAYYDKTIKANLCDANSVSSND